MSKIVMFTDIHFGCQGNSVLFNENCISFIQYMIDCIKENKVDKIVFLGDYFHSRYTINVSTLTYAIKGLEMLDSLNIPIKMIVGNHDLYYLNRRDVTSLSIGEKFNNIDVIFEPTIDNDCLYVPWLINDEKLGEIIDKNNCKYVFCHAEIPTFKLNSKVVFQGEYNPKDYQKAEYVFSGHFHHKEYKNNIYYIGNCFSHDFSDANDWVNKGFTTFDTETKELVQYEWKEAPKYMTGHISKIDKLNLNVTNCYLKLVNDCNLLPDKLATLQDELKSNFKFNDVFISPASTTFNETVETNIEHIDNVDTLICTLLGELETVNIDNNKLIKIYTSLEEKG